MTTKQILFSALMFGATSNAALAIEEIPCYKVLIDGWQNHMNNKLIADALLLNKQHCLKI